MGMTVFTGPVVSGDKFAGDANGPNLGYSLLEQQIQIPQSGAGNTDYTLYVPAGSIFQGFDVDVLTAFNSATSATLSIGTAAGGTQYVTGVDCKSATGRIAITYTAAQLAAMNGISVLGVAAPAPANVNIRMATVGATSAGFVNLTVRYAQLTSSN
jgi:hypothetical protein